MGVTSYLTVDGEILSETRSGVDSDYVPQPIGSTSALLNSSQTITDTFTWWPYGEQRSHSGSSITPFGCIGTHGYFCSNSNPYLYIRARYLDTRLTIWTTVDSYWPAQLQYNYSLSNPTSYIDPSGEILTIKCALYSDYKRCHDLWQSCWREHMNRVQKCKKRNEAWECIQKSAKDYQACISPCWPDIKKDSPPYSWFTGRPAPRRLR